MSIGTGIKGATSLLSSLFSGGGSSNVGLSDQEAALMQYQRHESILGNTQSTMPMSTGRSYRDAAAGIGAAAQGAGIVDQQLAANQAVQQANLQSLAQSAGFGTPGGVNPTPNVSTGANTGSSGGFSTPADQLAAGEIPV